MSAADSNTRPNEARTISGPAGLRLACTTRGWAGATGREEGISPYPLYCGYGDGCAGRETGCGRTGLPGMGAPGVGMGAATGRCRRPRYDVALNITNTNANANSITMAVISHRQRSLISQDIATLATQSMAIGANTHCQPSPPCSTSSAMICPSALSGISSHANTYAYMPNPPQNASTIAMARTSAELQPSRWAIPAHTPPIYRSSVRTRSLRLIQPKNTSRPSR